MNQCAPSIREALRNAVAASSDKPFALRLPAGVSFFEDRGLGEIGIHIGNRNTRGQRQDYVAGNMQTDPAAFEGWSIVLKAWLPQTHHIRLSWEIPNFDEENKGRLHYNRFLYRAHRFAQAYDWFHAPQLDQEEMPIKTSEPLGHYKVNLPAKKRDLTAQGMGSESEVELAFANNPFALLKETGMARIGNQLPIGVFDGKVSSKNYIFTGQKSAIDLWALNEAEDRFCIYELKLGENRKVGSLSELFFYSMVMKDLADRVMAYDPKQADGPAHTDPWPPTFIAGIKNIDAYLLIPELHPLMGDGRAVFAVMNNHLLQGARVQYGHVAYSSVNSCRKLQLQH